jgi:CRISPR-associated protein Cas5d
MKVERVSYPVMTPSAARGLIEAVLWKPAIRWHVERIHVLAPIRWIAFRRNEVNSKAAVPSRALIESGGAVPHLVADDDRAQRNTVALRDVDYVIEASFELTAQAGSDDNVPKFVDMFRRRVAKGQCFHRPYLGCRELAADVLPVDGAPPPISRSEDLGVMLWDVDYSPDGNRPLFFAARLENGILHVPRDPAASFGGEA